MQRLVARRHGGVMLRAAAAASPTARLSTAATANTSPAPSNKNIVVVGGAGHVGSEICRQAVSRGHTVTSVNRSGRPPKLQAAPWADKVRWLRADVFNPDQWRDVVDGNTMVVSSVGALGNSAVMERLIGDANIIACETAAAQGAAKFVLISAAPMNAESLDLYLRLPFFGSYVNAKNRAETSVRSAFGAGTPLVSAAAPAGNGGDGGADADAEAAAKTRATDAFALIRPGYIFGSTGALVGVPLRLVCQTLGLNRLPGVGPLFFEPPVAVSEVGKAAVAACERREVTGAIKTPQIQHLARAMNHTA